MLASLNKRISSLAIRSLAYSLVRQYVNISAQAIFWSAIWQFVTNFSRTSVAPPRTMGRSAYDPGSGSAEGPSGGVLGGGLLIHNALKSSFRPRAKSEFFSGKS